MSHDPFGPYQAVAQAAWESLSPSVAGYEACLTPILAHHFQSLGKLLRPALTIAVYEILTGTPCRDPKTAPPSLLQAALAIEILHNATLVHDDLQDGDEMRRGRPTVWKQFGAYQAINAGTALYFHAQRLLTTLAEPPEVRLGLLSVMIEQTLAIIAGQTLEKDIWLQFQAHEEDGAKRLYIGVVEKKTSALFALPLLTAALLAGESSEFATSLIRIARPLGALFQIQDDLLDLYGDKGRQSAGGDIAEGKPSLLVLHALYHLPEAEATNLRKIIHKPRLETTPEDIAWALESIRRSGAIGACLAQIEALQAQALAVAKSLPFRQPTPALPAFLLSVCQKILSPIQHLREGSEVPPSV